MIRFLGKSLREFKKEAQVGHVCQESELDVQSVQIGDCLEWWKDDCWWKACVVSNQSKNGKLNVRIRVHNSRTSPSVPVQGYKLQPKDKVRRWSELKLLVSSGYVPPPIRKASHE